MDFSHRQSMMRMRRQSFLCPDEDFIKEVERAFQNSSDYGSREIIKTSLKNRGALILTQDIDDAVKISNRIAPEHLELSVEDPESIVDDIKHAGAIFMGNTLLKRSVITALELIMFCPPQVLQGFHHPLVFMTLQNGLSIVMASKEGAKKLGETASVLAYGEGLQAHARSALYRTDKD